MSLSDLPDEILNLISIRLNGFDNYFLWMASDSKLRQRLLNDVITDFDIKYTKPGRYLWPGNFLKKLQRLSRLSVVVDLDIYHLPIQNVEIFPIPTLKYLKLYFTNSFALFDQNHPISSNDPTGPTSSSDDKYIDLNDYYSNLEHLEIITPPADGSFLSIDFLRFLPQKLKTLSIPQTYIKLDKQNPTHHLNKHIEILPQTLTTFDICFYYPSKAYLDLTKLPPNLTNLTTSACLDDQRYHEIPKNLKSLHLVSQKYNLDNLSPFLPTGLESLSLTTESSPTSPVLAHLIHLKNLSIGAQQQAMPRWDNFFTTCPPKLQSLTCIRLDFTDQPVSSALFTSYLTTLVLNGVVGIGAEFISALPQSLTELTIFSQYPTLQPKKPFAYFSLLPRNLKSFSTNFDILEKTSLLPESLKYLHLGSPTPDNWHLSFFDGFPAKLETLTLTQQLPVSILEHLPTSLTHLYFTSDETVDDDIIRMLPRGLKHLTLETADKITDAGVVDLPPHLKNFHLTYNTSITEKAIPFLPRSLRHLSLSHNPNFTDECIKHLPRNLIELFLDASKNITSNSCTDLPRYLEILSLPMCNDWDPEMLSASKNELPVFLNGICLGNREASRTWQKIVAEQKSNLRKSRVVINTAKN